MAFLAVAIALSMHLALQGSLQTKAAFILFLVAILVASIAGGIGPGLAALDLVPDERSSI